MRRKDLFNALAMALSFSGMLLSIFWDSLVASSQSPLQQAARVACPFLHDNALANAVEHLPLYTSSQPELEGLPLYSSEMLLKLNGENGERIAFGFAGVAYDVSSAAHLFGPAGEFHALAGRHATRAVLKSSVNPEDTVAFIDDLEVPRHAVEATADVLDKRFPRIALLP